MSSAGNADILYVDPNQTGKATAVNTALSALDQMLGDTFTAQVDQAAFASPFTLPYVAGDEPANAKTAIRFILLLAQGVLTADWTVVFPVGPKKLFVVQNATTGGFNVKPKATGGTGISVAPGGAKLCYLNGTDVVELPIAPPQTSQPWDVGNFIDGKPTAGQVVMRFIPSRTITFPANFANSQMKAVTPAAGTATFIINKNGVQVGTAVFAGGGTTATFTSTGGAPVVFAAGDLGTFIAPNPADSALADLDWVFSGTR